MRTPEEVLRAAADYIEQKGWKQGSEYRLSGPVCAIDAVGRVTDRGGVFPEFSEARRLLLLRIRARGEFPYEMVMTWNDAPGRTKAEVLAVLRGES